MQITACFLRPNPPKSALAPYRTRLGRRLGAARSRQELPGAARSRLDRPGAARSRQKSPGVARSRQKGCAGWPGPAGPRLAWAGLPLACGRREIRPGAARIRTTHAVTAHRPLEETAVLANGHRHPSHTHHPERRAYLLFSYDAGSSELAASSFANCAPWGSAGDASPAPKQRSG